MKVLSIRQPWAWLVCVGAKAIENRTWNTAHRGTIAIHAGGYRKAVEELVASTNRDAIDENVFSFGSIIGVAELFDAAPYHPATHEDPWAEGPVCLQFRNARLFKSPIAHKGRVNLCELPEDVARIVCDRMSECVDVSENVEVRRMIESIPIERIAQKHVRRTFRPSTM